jgi:hypothetical protein
LTRANGRRIRGLEPGIRRLEPSDDLEEYRPDEHDDRQTEVFGSYTGWHAFSSVAMREKQPRRARRETSTGASSTARPTGTCATTAGRCCPRARPHSRWSLTPSTAPTACQSSRRC